jgi:glycosyltransferase involved in cell wall biosynthesis
VGAAIFASALLRAARRLLDDCDALVSSWCIPSGWVASTVAEGRDHLCLCHATDVRWLSKVPARRAIARRIVEGATSLWFLSREQRERFFDSAGLCPSVRPTHLGSMPIELPRALGLDRDALRQELGIRGFTLLFLGRLTRDKGVDQLITAAAQCRGSVALRIAGDGPERRSAEALARKLGVEATFEGWVRGDRKEALLRACDGLVVPSRMREGLPTVLFEARARSLPLIATRVGDIGAAFGVDARLVPPERADALADAILALRARAQGATRSVPFGGR